MEFVIITGMSGAGKNSAQHILEDIGYYCVDNIPATLLKTFYLLCEESSDERMKKVAVVVDSRGNESSQKLRAEVESFKNEFDSVRLLFLDAKEDVLVIRFKETRRKHPLAALLKDVTVAEEIMNEREFLTPIIPLADFHIDTTNMSVKQLRERLRLIFMDSNSHGLTLTFMSFGFKYGIPLEADLILDVRCLPNPFYIADLKPLTGNDKAVRDYVLDSAETQGFLKRTLDLLDFSVPLYVKEGKSELVVGVGCTGGQHRSVTIARSLNEHFLDKGFKCVLQHRDITK